MRRAVPPLLVAALLLPAAAALPADAVLVTTEDGASTRFEAFDTTKLTLFDLDGDGRLEVVAHNDNNRVYVLDATRGRVLAELETNHPPGWPVRELNDVAVGDLDADGRPDLVVANSASWLTRFEFDALNSTADRLAFHKLWEVRVDPREYEEDFMANHPWMEGKDAPSMDGGPYLADADGDGTLEIFVQTDGWPGHFSFDADGELRWITTWSDGNSNPWVADLDGDDRPEALFATDSGRLYAYDAKGGHLEWVFDASKHADPGSISVSPAVADLDGDGLKEVVFGVRHAVEDPDDPEWYLKQNARFFAVTPPGSPGGKPTLLWNFTAPWLNPHTYTHPAVLDVDGDGDLDVLTMDWNTVGHKPGDWQQTGKANLFALEGASGRLLWRQEIESPWSNKDLAVADVDGDGTQEIVLADPRHGRSAITFRDLETGEYEDSVPAPDGWGTMRGPVVADVDADGRLEVLQSLHRDSDHCTRDLDVGCREGAILVLQTQGTEAAWSGRFTFDLTTEHVYPDAGSPSDSPRVTVAWGPYDAEALVVEVRSNVHVADVEVTDGTTTVDLDPSDDGLWRGARAFAPGTRVEVQVAHDGGATVAALTVPEAPSADVPAEDGDDGAVEDEEDGNGTFPREIEPRAEIPRPELEARPRPDLTPDEASPPGHDVPAAGAVAALAAVAVALALPRR